MRLMSSANHDGSRVIQCNCGRKAVAEASTLNESGWASFTFQIERKVTWLCPTCAGRRVDVTTTLRAPWFRAA